MASFHVLHWIPDPRLHIFNGYNEVIETLLWGLARLGHDVTYAVNSLRAGATPIVLGAQMMDRAMLAGLPPDSILYNLEQLDGLRATGRHLDDLAWAGRHFTVWDYSEVNVRTWRELGANAAHVPIGFAPVLSRIERAAHQDVDVLIYAAPSATRLLTLSELCGIGRSALFVCGLYGAARDALVGRAKLVLCLTSNADSPIFSIVRASYLMANRKAVLGDLACIERDIAGGVAIAPRSHLAALCDRYLAVDEDRHRLEQAGYDVIARRDIRPILRSALAPQRP